MSTNSDGPDLVTTIPPLFVHAPASYEYVITHVFFPLKLPGENDYTLEKDLSLLRAVCAASHTCSHTHDHGPFGSQWDRVTRMLHNLQASVQYELLDSGHVISQLREMQAGDILTFFFRPQNATLILTKQEGHTLFESFEVSPSNAAVMESEGRLRCSYPEFAIKVPNDVFEDSGFQILFANIISSRDTASSDLSLPRLTCSQDITAVLTVISQHSGCCAVDVPCITKHVRDEAVKNWEQKIVWRRSTLWLLIRIAIQCAVEGSLGHASYKIFLLFFMCVLARDPTRNQLSSDLLHLISSKILRRLSKLGASAPDWLSKMALKTCAGLRDILDERWNSLTVTRLSPFRNPSQDELRRDTQLSLLHSRGYIEEALEKRDYKPDISFHPSECLRGTIDDFLSSDGSFFDKAYRVNPSTAMYDVEESVQQELDDWIARVTDVEEACVQLEILMDMYIERTHREKKIDPEQRSIRILTAVQLFVALDKLVMEDFPMLVDYSPEIPIDALEELLLYKTTSLHHLARACQYLSARQAQSRPGWSMLPDEFTEDSFAVRYYDQSPHLQQLKAHIEQGAIPDHNGWETESASRSLLPVFPLHAKVVVFELRCPTCIRVWRNAVTRVLRCCYQAHNPKWQMWIEDYLFTIIPGFQAYFVERQLPRLTSEIRFAYFYQFSENNPAFCYALVTMEYLADSIYKPELEIWQHNQPGQGVPLRYYDFEKEGDSLRKYVEFTSHTSNDIMAAQAYCPNDISLDEFVAFGHLRSAVSLEWLNILYGLRSRSLNLSRRPVHLILSKAAFQVGQLDPRTGVWLLHQELQDSSFCDALLDELQKLMDVGVRSIDPVTMGSISLLLVRVLASSPSERVSEQAITLLRNVRRKTFGWVQDLTYDLTLAPIFKERSDLLRDMAVVCRSTFDTDRTIHHKHLHSAEDIDSILSCSFFGHVFSIPPKEEKWVDPCSRQFWNRHQRLTFDIHWILRSLILADASDYAVDLAVSKIFPVHQPSKHKWEQLPHPNSHWIKCENKYQHSQTIHVNLLEGSLQLRGFELGGMPSKFKLFDYRITIFRDQGFFMVPSDLPGMDVTTIPTMSKHKIHVSLCSENMVIRVQHDETNEVLELIPQAVLKRDLLPRLIDEHVHWWNLSTRTIEIRPLHQPWQQSSENWMIDCATEQYRLYKGHETLVDIHSPTWEMISQCFQCFTQDKVPPNLVITTFPVQSSQPIPVLRLFVALPDYDLHFFVNDDRQLESRDFKDMVYDENQSIGTLFGLEHFLVLRHKIHITEGLVSRRILIPDGNPDTVQDHFERVVRFSRPRGFIMTYHVYDVDTDLGRLRGDGSLSSMRFLACLHSATSWHRPDPLTGKTSAHAAFSLFQSAGCRSIVDFGALYDDGIMTSWGQLNSIKAWPDEQRVACLSPWRISTGPIPLGLTEQDCDGSTHGCLLTHIPTEHGVPVPWPIRLGQLLSSRGTPELPARSSLPCRSITTPPANVSELNLLLSLLKSQFDDSFQREYVTRLNASVQRVHEESQTRYEVVAGENRLKVLERYYVGCRRKYLDALDALRQSLGPLDHPHGRLLEEFGYWPPITGYDLLRCLASTSPIIIPPRWKKCLTLFALLLLDLQRSRRLFLYAWDGLDEEYSKELENEGCDGWSPDDHPDWLLLQIEGNFLIRRTQADVAKELMSPKSGENTVMQVNMGEGKTSVIIPIAAAALADGNQLVRVIVPKALTIQMSEKMISLMGGLVNRPIYYLPFSRTDERLNGVIGLRQRMSQCMAERGILLVQPEHVASLKLMGIEKQASKEVPIASSSRSQSTFKQIMMPRKDSLVGKILQSWSQSQTDDRGTSFGGHYHSDEPPWDVCEAPDATSKWLDLQMWISSHVRDILDESDEILRAQFQLVYTIGLEQHLDGYPERWTITQQVLRLAKGCAYTLSRNHTGSVEYECSTPGSFPQIRIVGGPDVGLEFVSLIVQGVMDGRLPTFHFQDLSQSLADAIRSFISEESILPDAQKKVEEYASQSHQNNLWSCLLLLRGLLASNMLWIIFSERRWRVNYGLELEPPKWGSFGPSATLAIPFRAKDVPAPNTQFGHPDITIILTCLSYYYTGLAEEQLRLAFQILLCRDDPCTEYTMWVKEYGNGSKSLLPESLRELGEINLKSSEQWDKFIFPLFSRNHAVIEFYLSRVVFPKEAKEFPWKISASSWDLAEIREKLITGFSGTNDSRWLLPMTITQHDPDHQQGTNAKILAYLLRRENDFYAVNHKNGERQDTVTFLGMVAIQLPRIHILLDVGAQILDLSNHQVAKAWLSIAHDADGAVYFDESDELTVLTRNDVTRSLRSSPLLQRLDRCVVYLDHAHTRGTDIKLPLGSRAAVTLGPKVTKDSLVQGCMRMRKLGQGHSVMFFAPIEVDRAIRTVAGKSDPNARVTTADILCWAIHETWTDIQRWAPYWARQGMGHKSRHDAWSKFALEKLTGEELVDAWLQPNTKSLADLYSPCEAKKASSSFLELTPEIRQRCKDLGVLSLPDAQLEEEKEREVNREREREREVALPPKAVPAVHSLHADVVTFVKTGVIPPLHPVGAFIPVFTTLGASTAATCDAEVWSASILATTDFCKTVEPDSTPGTMDQYLRPVQWILTRKVQRESDQVLVLLSPFEADRLISDIRASKHVHLHLYAPRMSKRTKPSDDLKLYTIPPLPSDWTPPDALMDQLNVFAGQLYLRDYQSYLRLCRFLGVPTRDSPDAPVRWNLFDIPGTFEEYEIRFSGSPLPSVMALLAIRNRGRPFSDTHMGRILQGQVLTEEDF